MKNNVQLNQARYIKNDEFYTQLKDIEKELQYYEGHFKDKAIYCNCDGPTSNFIKYFQDNFIRLGLKTLMTSHFDTETGTGDFRSKECLEMLQEADIIITNPPFSLFREWIAQLIKYNKKFLIMGNLNSINYKEIFTLMKDNTLWLGATMNASEFEIPKRSVDLDKFTGKLKDGKYFQRVAGIRWYTNLDCTLMSPALQLTKNYSPEDYPKYDNDDAIEVSRVKNIPMDYTGTMGVPISFFDKYNPEQFEILGKINAPLINGKHKYVRVLIKIKETDK